MKVKWWMLVLQLLRDKEISRVKMLKKGEGDDLWNENQNQNKKKHKDIDTSMYLCFYFQYQLLHDFYDRKKFRHFSLSILVTDASVNDSQALESLLDEKDKGQDFYADSAYTGQEQEEIIENFNLVNKVHEKGY